MAYSYLVTDGQVPFSYAITSGALPPGLSLNASTGAISGTPTTVGTYNWDITITDALSRSSALSDTVVITSVAVAIAGDAPDNELTTPYNFIYSVQGSATPLVVTLKTGALPPGLAISTAGILSGTPTTTGVYSWTLEAKDANNVTATVNDSSQTYAKVTISGDAGDGTIGGAYSFTYIGASGKPPYAFVVTAGTLPTGLTLSTAGVLSGTPTTASAFSWLVGITDSLGGISSLADSSNITDPATSDPYFASVAALLHFDGNATDVKGKVWTVSGSPGYETTSPLYGTGSLKTDGFGGSEYLTSPSSADFNFGTGDFTIELAVAVLAGTPAGYYFFDAIGGNLTVIQWNPTGHLAYYDPVTGSAGALYNNGPANAALVGNGRHEIAICRSGSTIYAFCDGVMWGSQAGATHNKTHTQVRINGYGAGTTQGNVNTLFDEVRITKGVARYTANYTPRSTPFPNS